MDLATQLPQLLGIAWLLPLASFVLILFFGPKMGPHGRNAAWVATAAIVTSLVLSLVAFVSWLGAHPVTAVHHGGDHDPEHREAEQRQGLEEPRVAARPVEVAAPGEVHLVVGDVVEFVVHVARRVDVDAGGDERDHHEHQHGQGVDVPADGEFEPAAAV